MDIEMFNTIYRRMIKEYGYPFHLRIEDKSGWMGIQPKILYDQEIITDDKIVDVVGTLASELYRLFLTNTPTDLIITLCQPRSDGVMNSIYDMNAYSVQ